MRSGLKQVPAVLALLALAAIPAQAQVYKWTDEQGRVHFSDQPPPGAKAQELKLQINSYGGPAVVSRVAPALAGGKAEVVLYSAVWCGYCKNAKAFLAARGVPFRELDVETSDAGRAGYARLNGRGVPIILVGESRMDGFDARRLEEMLRNL